MGGFAFLPQKNSIRKFSDMKHTNIRCYWCLHECDNVVNLPYNSVNNSIGVYGTFCCPECAASFNFNELNDEYSWERYSLLNYIYNDETKVKMAPSRLLLDIFGGPLTINESRNIKNTGKSVNIIMPPHYIICPQIEINTNDNMFIPLNVNRVNKYTKDLKLKRPDITHKKNTLDNCMNLKCI